jgi:hypothetical protein
MSMTEDVRGAFAGYGFGPPVSPEEIDEAGWTLGHTLPAVLVELDSAFDGFEGPTATSFFDPLIRPRPFSGSTLVEQTLWLRSEDYFPEFFRRAVAFGDYGCGSCWGIRLDAPGEVFEWHPSDGEADRVIGDDLSAVWLEAKRRSDELDPGA